MGKAGRTSSGIPAIGEPMNDHLIRNLPKTAVSYVLYYSGVLNVLLWLFVRRGLLIFSYHGFSTFTNDYWKSGSLFESGFGKNFEKQVCYLDRHFLKLAECRLEKAFVGRATYFLTFDDGYKDNFLIALPILNKYAIPGIFFIVTSVIGTNRLLWYDSVRLRYEQNGPTGRWESSRSKRACKNELARLKRTPGALDTLMNQASPEGLPPLMMDWEDIRRAYGAGILIGAHTDTHPILSALPPDSQREEILKSIEIIRQQTGRNPEFFSYPDGKMASFNEETVRVLKEGGVRYALTTEEGINRASDAAPYCLKRIGLNPSDPVPLVVLKIVMRGLRTRFDLQAIRKRRISIELAVRQYGLWNAARRALKSALRMIGFHYESYWVLTRDLTAHLEAPSAVPGLVVRPLDYEDIEASSFSREFSPQKKELLKRRFSSPGYKAFGAELGGELVYITWIATDTLRIEAMHFEQELGQGEGVLLDSATLPKARGLGIHTYMSWYRLKRLKDAGIRRTLVAVVTENRPALKALFKVGFVTREKLTWLKWGCLSRHFYSHRSGA